MFAGDTIAALATPPGKGGVGIIRVSGPAVTQIATALLKRELTPRHAVYTPFLDHDGQTIDQGIALYFKAPHSFTGEDVLELQGHGGPVVMDWLLERTLALGARPARPGEFSERAFLNDKLDLTQAEAIADLIDASSRQAAKQAMQSLDGAFSQRIHQLVEGLIQLRIYVEAAIDFPEEEVDFLNDGHIQHALDTLKQQQHDIKMSANQGALLREGLQVVIAGKPNAGKSSLLNALSGRESAIVTDIAGTTRDVLREHIHIDGMPLHIIDTAGLRESNDQVERIGIDRAKQAISKADVVLLVVDLGGMNTLPSTSELIEELLETSVSCPVVAVYNKCDLQNEQNLVNLSGNNPIFISAKTGFGLDELRQQLKKIAGFEQTTEGGFIARRRHLNALTLAEGHVAAAEQRLIEGAGELVAEELKLAQDALCEITGEFSSDDLLGRIFSSFCIGK